LGHELSFIFAKLVFFYPSTSKKEIAVVLAMSITAQKSAPAVTTGTGGVLTVTTTTSDPGSTKYGSEHVLAIWIEDGTGALVNTMLFNTSNGNSTASDMSSWFSKIGSWSNRTLKTTLDLDASSGATNTSYGVKTAKWGSKASVSAVADGTYTVNLEIVSNNVALNSAGHKLVSYTFTKGATSSTGTLVGSAQSCFTGTTVQWTPATTALNNPELDALYKVYPNPTKSTIYVDGSDVQQVEIFSVAGKSILKSNQHNLNLAGLAKGTYLAEITTAKGKLVKKIIKE
jgi:hypothetical protein